MGSAHSSATAQRWDSPALLAVPRPEVRSYPRYVKKPQSTVVKAAAIRRFIYILDGGDMGLRLILRAHSRWRSVQT